MAEVANRSVVMATYDDEDMTDEQMQELLAQAAARMQERNSLAFAQEEGHIQTTFPKLSADTVKPYVTTKGDVAAVDATRLLAEKDRKLSNRIRKVEDPVAVQKRLAESKKATAGESWYNLPKTELTQELKRDLQLLKMRNVLNPHRHYKKDNGKMKAPEYSQVGTIVEGPTEYFSARIQNKDRKRTFVEEVLATEKDTGRFKKKYGEVQDKKTSGKKGFYNALKAKRSHNFKKM